MSFQNLPNVHTGRNAQRIQHNVNGRTVRQEGHILLAHNLRNNALVTVPPAHFIADGNFALLSNINTNLLIDTRGHFVIVIAGKSFNVDDFTGFTVRNAQRSITKFTNLFAENGAQKAFFGG